MLLGSNDIPAFDPKKKGDSEAAAVRLQLRHKYSLAETNSLIAEAIGTPKMGEEIHFWTGARWSMHNLVHYLLGFTGPAELLISTYTISEDALRLLKLMYDSEQLTRIRCLIDKRFSVRSEKALQLGKLLFEEYTLIDCHAKITILENDKWKVAVIGSANWSENKRYEAGVIYCSEEATAFWKEKIEKALRDEKAYRR